MSSPRKWICVFLLLSLCGCEVKRSYVEGVDEVQLLPGNPQDAGSASNLSTGVKPMDGPTSDAGAGSGSEATDMQCRGCSLDGECRAAGEANPDNPCEVCDPEGDGSSWAFQDGVACDDNLYCTTDDTCEAGQCVGVDRTCDDEIACNGVSICLEGEGACASPENQCTDQLFCDVALGDCVSTCDGCNIAGVCLVAGAVTIGNSCLICDPSQSATSYSVATGQQCGVAPTECSAQDTCNPDGTCGANDLPEGVACGAAAGGECDSADTCDGTGQCVVRRAGNGTPCDDGQFCTVADQCQGGQCVPGAPRNCEANRSCSEDSNECTCNGCLIDDSCVASGTADPANPCRLCQPEQSLTSYSPNFGAACGQAATECSAQDTCNAQGECATNNSQPGTLCGFIQGGAQCDAADTCDGNGQCVLRVAQDGDPCNDGLFCTQGDSCQGGQCVRGEARDCGANRNCDENGSECRCGGCSIAGTCFASGAVNPGNSCQVCNPNQNSFGFVGNVGASCGSGPNECSAQDTCNAQAQCVVNDRSNGTACSSIVGGQCENARCVPSPLGTGEACGNDNECSSGRCETWFRDRDSDGFGTTDDVLRTCGSTGGSSLPPNGYVASQGDCCDLGGVEAVQARTIFPGQSQFFDVPHGLCGLLSRDFNCSDDIEFLFQEDTQAGGGGCAFSGCNGTTVWDISRTGGTPPACGSAGPILSCSGTSGACSSTEDGFTLNFCH